MKTRSGSLALLFAIAGATCFISAAADAQTADHGKIAILSRSVMVFSQLEQSLDAALSGNDQAAQEKLLAADFELRPASNPGVPMARAEWLKGDKPSANSEMSQMAVHDHGTLAIASFLRSTPSDQPDQPAKLTFVVDVWKKQGSDWQLDTRYEADAGSASATEEDVKPDGKG
jgi:hypothetical protein